MFKELIGLRVRQLRFYFFRCTHHFFLLFFSFNHSLPLFCLLVQQQKPNVCVNNTSTFVFIVDCLAPLLTVLLFFINDRLKCKSQDLCALAWNGQHLNKNLFQIWFKMLTQSQVKWTKSWRLRLTGLHCLKGITCFI